MANGKRILHVLADESPGGGTTAVLGLCADTTSRDMYEVRLASAAGSYAIQAAHVLGIKVHPLQRLPSLWEGLPIIASEASYLELPIVASKVSGTTEVIRAGLNGIIIEEFSPRAYADHIVNLLDNPGLRKRIGGKREKVG